MINCDENCTCCQYFGTDKCPFDIIGNDREAETALDDVFLLEMDHAITEACVAAGEKSGAWKQWVADEHPAQVQALLGEGLQRHFRSLLRTPMLIEAGGLKVGSAYQHLVHIAIHAMMLALAVRHEVARVEDEHMPHRCGIADAMGGAA